MTARDTRQRIIDAALALFAEKGYAETSIGDVAVSAGLLKGNLSYYFRTKEDLLEWVTRERERQLIGDLGKSLPAGASAGQAMAHFLDFTDASADELARHGCPVGTLCSELGKDDPSLQPYAAHILAAVHRWIVEHLGDSVSATTANAVAEQLLVMMQGAAVLAHAQRDPGVVHRVVANARMWLAATLPVEVPAGSTTPSQLPREQTARRLVPHHRTP